MMGGAFYDRFYVPASGGGGGGAATTSGTYAARPAAGNAGAAYLSTDGPYYSVDDGAAWTDFLPGFGEVVVPPSAGWSWVNQAGSTRTDAGGSISITGGSGNLSLLMRSVGPTPWTLDAIIERGPYGAGNEQVYLAMQNAGGNLIVWGDIVNDVRIHRWNSPTSFNSSGTNVGKATTQMAYRIANDGTTITFYDLIAPGSVVSLATETVAAFIGTVTEIGFGTRSTVRTRLLHWNVT